MIGRVIATIAITVSVAIAIAITVVAITRGCSLGAIEDDVEAWELLVDIELFDILAHGTLEETTTNDEQRQIGILADEGSIGNHLMRRTIKNNEVVFLTCLLHDGS